MQNFLLWVIFFVSGEGEEGGEGASCRKAQKTMQIGNDTVHALCAVPVLSMVTDYILKELILLNMSHNKIIQSSN